MEKELQEKQRIRQEVVEKISEKTEIEIPEVLIAREQKIRLERIKHDVKVTLQMEFDEYLEKIQKTEQELLSSLSKEAEKTVTHLFLLREIAKKEDITATSEEVEKEVNQILLRQPKKEKMEEELGQVRDSDSDNNQQKENISDRVDTEQLRLYTRGVIVNEKTLQFLEDLVQDSSS